MPIVRRADQKSYNHQTMQLTLICSDCNNEQLFIADDEEAAMKEATEAGWLEAGERILCPRHAKQHAKSHPS